jgi:hypothetical protein
VIVSGSARTALIRIELEFTVTDMASEGEMLDAVTRAIVVAKPELESPNGQCSVRVVASHVTTKHTGGSL